ncbi:MAG: 1-deoxy-D-xylulose-5-phosphate reductoisomerase [Candidatus Omnitrophota bacterium]
MKKVTIFGSTGSVGKSALDVVRASGGALVVEGLCACRDTKTLQAQVREFSPARVCVVDAQAARAFRAGRRGMTVFRGPEGLDEFTLGKTDIAVMAISGISALKPLLSVIPHARRVALVNKESIVAGGSFVFARARTYGTQILPVDSEINALFQLFKAHERRGNGFDRVYITASGGALFGYSRARLQKVTVRDVLAHPTWNMGARITVDSATLVNKAFEVIETHHFFNVAYSKIGVVIHRKSQIHAFVEFCDKTIMACMYPADMRIPIAFALHYPRRVENSRGIDFSRSFSFDCAPFAQKQFPLFELVMNAAARRDNGLVVLNAADEKAIEYFLKNKIGFTDIGKVMEYMGEHYPSTALAGIEDVFYWNEWASSKAEEYIQTLC